MARTYKRDSRGRFAGGGGGGKKAAAPKSKAGQTRSANVATTKRLMDAGLRGTGSRLRSKTGALYAGSKATKARQSELWSNVEGNQRRGVDPGAQRSKAKVGGTIKRR